MDPRLLGLGIQGLCCSEIRVRAEDLKYRGAEGQRAVREERDAANDEFAVAV